MQQVFSENVSQSLTNIFYNTETWGIYDDSSCIYSPDSGTIGVYSVKVLISYIKAGSKKN